MWNSLVDAQASQDHIEFGLIDTVLNKELKKVYELATLPEFVIFS